MNVTPTNENSWAFGREHRCSILVTKEKLWIVLRTWVSLESVLYREAVTANSPGSRRFVAHPGLNGTSLRLRLRDSRVVFAGFCHVFAVFWPPFHDSGFDAVGAIVHLLRADDTQQLAPRRHATKRIRQQLRKRFDRLPRGCETQSVRRPFHHDTRRHHHRTDRVEHDRVHRQFLPHHRRRFTRQDAHRQVAFEGPKVQFDLPSTFVQFGKLRQRILRRIEQRRHPVQPLCAKTRTLDHGPKPTHRDRLGESLSGFAVGAGVERFVVLGIDGEAGGGQFQEGVSAGASGVEDSGEEGPEGDGGREGALAEGDVFVGDGLLELFRREDVGEGVCERERVTVRGGGRRIHGGTLRGVVGV